MTLVPTAGQEAVSLPFTREDIEADVPSRFDAVVRRFPDRTALAGSNRSWTFEALDDDASRLAHAIARLTPRGEGCVAWLLPQSPQMVVATLGVLKAGKAFLALHPATPAPVLASTIENAAPDLLVTDAASLAHARELTGDRIPVLAIEEGLGERPLRAPVHIANPGDACAIYYTSGSTGLPKGVVRSHRATLHRVWLGGQYDAIVPGDRQSLLTHCSFSASDGDVFAALLHGAAVCTFDAATHGLGEFREWLERERITLLHPPVVYFRRFLATLEGERLFPSVRLVALAGDVVLPRDIRQWRRRFSPGCILVHRFSITETALLTVARLEHSADARQDPRDLQNVPALQNPPFGPPVPDKRLDLVDEHHVPVGTGDIGELIVRSRYLASGYWRRPDETAARFSDDPDTPGVRIYRTGDLGRFLPDGRFVFLGRRDHQVKVRGYRVELGEIEAAIAEIDGIAEAAVVAPRPDGETELHAFAVAAPGSAPDGQTVRRRLQATLPSWKIPSGVHFLDALPTLLTGKVDRQALVHRVETLAPSVPAPHVAQNASDEIEERVAEIYAGVLRGRAIASDADFFAMGGTSLELAELQVLLEAAFWQPVPTDALLKHSSVRGAAEVIRSGQRQSVQGSGAAPVLVTLRPSGAGAPIFLVHGGALHAVTRPHLLDALAAGRPVYGFRARGFAEGEEPHRSIEAMAAEYVARVRDVQPEGPYHLGSICLGWTVAFEMARQLRAAGQAVAPMLLIGPPPPPGRWRVSSLLRRAALETEAAMLGLPVGGRVLARGGSGGSAFHRRRRRAQLHFRRALYRHAPAPSRETVFVVGGRDRLRHLGTRSWRRLLRGEVLVREIGERHLDVFDGGNQRATEALREYATLPAPGAPLVSADAVAGRDDLQLARLELRVARLFARVLRQPGGPTDGDAGGFSDFFDRGGNSVQLAELQLLLEAEFGRRVPLDRLLADTTIAGVAALLRAPLPEHDMTPGGLVPVRPASRGTPVFLVHGGSIDIVVRPHLVEALAPERPVRGFRPRGLLEGEEPHRAIPAIAAEYVARMRAAQPSGPYDIAAMCVGWMIALEMARLLREAGERVGPVLLIDPPPAPRWGRRVPFLVRRSALAAMTKALDVPVAGPWLQPLAGGRRGARYERERVRLRFRLAVYDHQPLPTAETVFVVGSRARLRHFQGAGWQSLLTGDVHLREVSDDHHEVFDASNERVARALREYAAMSRRPAGCL